MLILMLSTQFNAFLKLFFWLYSFKKMPQAGQQVLSSALKLAINSHSPLPKIRNWRSELTLSLAKNSHFSFLPSHFSSLPSRRGYHCGAENRNEFTLSISKFFSPSLFPLFQMARAARRVSENPRQMIKSYPVLFCSSHRKNESN